MFSPDNDFDQGIDSQLYFEIIRPVMHSCRVSVSGRTFYLILSPEVRPEVGLDNEHDDYHDTIVRRLIGGWRQCGSHLTYT